MPRRTTTDAKLDRAIGARLRAARQRKGWTQTQLSVALSLQAETVSRYETGAVSLSLAMLYRMASMLGVGVEELLGLAPRGDLGAAESELVQRFRGLDKPGQKVVMELIRWMAG